MMAVRTILLLGNPILREKCKAIRQFNAPALRKLIVDLRDTLYDFRKKNGFGRGIAAPQIGVNRRIIFIHVDEPIVLINPIITRRSRKLFSLWDDCFSFPNLLVKVKRHSHIEVRYQDEAGKKHMLKARGGLSELIQHEIDHINRILAIDRAISSKHIIFRSEHDTVLKKADTI